jgi:hypothetical protein
MPMLPGKAAVGWTVRGRRGKRTQEIGEDSLILRARRRQLSTSVYSLIFFIVLGIASLLMLSGCAFFPVATIRYRLTVKVDVAGLEKTGSSIIQVKYMHGSTVSGSPTVYPYPKGVAPVIDLGRNGFLILSIDQYHTESQSLITRNENSRCGAKYYETAHIAAYFLEHAFELGYRRFDKTPKEAIALKIGRLRDGQQAQVSSRLAAFIWYPENGSITQGKYFCADELSEAIGIDIQLRSIKAEIANGTPVTAKLEISPPWLEQIRAQEKKRESTSYTWSKVNAFVPNLKAFEQLGDGR